MKTVDDYGRVIVSSDTIFEMLYSGIDTDDVFVEDSDTILEYECWCKIFDKPTQIKKPEHISHSPEEEHNQRSQHWFIPEEECDIKEYLLSKCKSSTERTRVEIEYSMFETRGLVVLLKLMKYIVDTLRQNNVVWGVGRGSSVSSYCLYLIGVHKIDSIKYGLPITDFLR